VSSETPAAAGAPPAAIEIPPGSLDGRLSFPRLFGDPRPVEMEIGTGKGRFLLAEAAARPGVGFFGVEWSLKYVRLARERAERLGLRNVRLLRADARHVVADLLPDASLERIHVYCPDPWPKKRHHKRRFFAAPVVPHLERVLAPEGTLHVSTDVPGYFQEIRAVLAAHTGLAEITEPPLAPAEGGRTSYEAKYLQAGRVIHRACWRRPAGGDRGATRSRG
jgi:tRNA (guanine-N7-)-methyltransferase